MKKAITWIFILSCLCALLFLCLPLILRFDCVYNCISAFLSAFRNTEYKGLYIETLGALFGAFLGVIGAVLAQNLANKQSKAAEIENTAQVLYADLKDSLKRVSTVFSDPGFPKGENDLIHAIAHEEENELHKFDYLVYENRIIMLPDWKQMILSIEEKLSSDDLRILLVTYTELSELSSLTSNNDDKRWRLKVYSILTSVSRKTSSLQQISEKLSAIS